MKKITGLAGLIILLTSISYNVVQAQTLAPGGPPSVQPTPAPAGSPVAAPSPLPMQPQPAQQPVYAAPPAQVVVQQPVVIQQAYCQPYTDKFYIGQEVRITSGTACLHPDGSWELHPAQAGVNYVTRGGSIFVVPSQPFASVVIASPSHHRHDW